MSQGWSARKSLLAGSFPVEQSAPAFDAPGISRERAIVADHTMAGNGDGEIVRGARSGNRTCRPRGPNTPRDLGIADRLADPNLPQRLPNTLLEGRAADIKGKVEADRGCFDEADDPRDQCLIVAIATNETRFRKTILEITDELVRVFSQQNGGASRLARGDKHGAKGGLSDRELDLLVRAPSAIPRRRHAEHIRGVCVEASAGIEAGVIDRLGHAVGGGQSLTNFVRTLGGGIALRREPSDGLKHAMEVAWAAADRTCQFFQRRLLFALLDDPARLRYQGRIRRFDRRSVRIAAPARSKAGRPGTFQAVVELDVLGVGVARGARRPAIDTCRCDGVPDTTVGCLVACDNARPSRVICHWRERWLRGLCDRRSHLHMFPIWYWPDDAANARRTHSDPCVQIRFPAAAPR